MRFKKGDEVIITSLRKTEKYHGLNSDIEKAFDKKYVGTIKHVDQKYRYVKITFKEFHILCHIALDEIQKYQEKTPYKEILL